MKKSLLCILLGPASILLANAQEATSGLDVRSTISAQFAASSLSTESPRSGSPVTGGYRVVVYPTWKLSDHWTITAALQSYSHPYFYESLSTANYGIRDNILQATLGYSRVSDKGSLLIRAGHLSTAFGSFLLHYDDADNALIDIPAQYGYYYKPVTSLSVSGAQVDVTRGKFDARAQFANSSPANPRTLSAHDQYGNWAGGIGYTPRQGLHLGASSYRGPYLSRDYAYFFPGEAKPSTLNARAIGVDASWAHGHWNTQGEWQAFEMPYELIPIFREQAGYVETKRVVHPRWYIAARGGYTHSKFADYTESLEATAGYRPNRLQVIKFGYELQHHNAGTIPNDHTFTIQLVTSLHLFSLAGK